jgi:hypothetical protein
MKPYPTIRRSGTGAQRAIGDLLIRSMGNSRHTGDGLGMKLIVFIPDHRAPFVGVHRRPSESKEAALDAKI